MAKTKSAGKVKSISDPRLDKLDIKELRKIAKAAGLTKYGKLKVVELRDLLARESRLPFVFRLIDKEGEELGFCLPEDRPGIKTTLWALEHRERKTKTRLDKERLKYLLDVVPDGHLTKEEPK